ncbi:MAG: hypothetical protein AB7N24_20455 [Dehalococcoidia bacterium]
MNVKTSALVGLVLCAGILSASGSTTGRTEESRAYRAYITSAARDGLATDEPPPAAAGLPGAPANWPTQLGIGVSDAPGGAAQLGSEGFAFRYQYLAGGANTGSGWQSWEADGKFVEHYIEESERAAVIPVFSYYMVRQSEPGSTMQEQDGVKANLVSDSTMRSIFDDLAAFFRSAGAATNSTVVLHFEPDLWGYIEQQSKNDDASTVKISVGSSGQPDVVGLPDTASGLARAVLRLRDLYAPNVLVSYHFSAWGTGIDPLYANPSDQTLDELSERSVDFYHSLGAEFDLGFAEMTDRDAGFKEDVYGDHGASWWDEADFANNVTLLGNFVQGTGLRVVLWQLPFGNTVMRSMDNSWDHYQDNKVEWLLGDRSYSHLRAYMNAGVIGLLFGRGADGATCACDAAGDGITNPAPINGNDALATSADDDGGYFRERASEYLSTGGLLLP